MFRALLKGTGETRKENNSAIEITEFSTDKKSEEDLYTLYSQDI